MTLRVRPACGVKAAPGSRAARPPGRRRRHQAARSFRLEPSTGLCGGLLTEAEAHAKIRYRFENEQQISTRAWEPPAPNEDGHGGATCGSSSLFSEGQKGLWPARAEPAPARGGNTGCPGLKEMTGAPRTPAGSTGALINTLQPGDPALPVRTLKTPLVSGAGGQPPRPSGRQGRDPDNVIQAQALSGGLRPRPTDRYGHRPQRGRARGSRIDLPWHLL